MNTSITTRPSRRDDFVIETVAAKLAPKVNEWLQDEASDDVYLDIKRALRCGDQDGYALAKEMEDIGYEADAALVEALDSASFLTHAAYEELCRKWVEDNAIPAPAIGLQVRCVSRGKEVTGEVVKNWPDGRSTVCCPELGHVRAGSGCHGLILDWEQFTPAQP